PFRNAAPDRDLAGRHHRGSARSADGTGRHAVAADPRGGGGDATIEGAGEVIFSNPHPEVRASSTILIVIARSNATKQSTSSSAVASGLLRFARNDGVMRHVAANRLLKLSRLTRARAWRPSPIRRSPSNAST